MWYFADMIFGPCWLFSESVLLFGVLHSDKFASKTTYMKKRTKKDIHEEKDTDDEIKLLAKFAERLDKQNEVIKKLLEEKNIQNEK